MCQLVRSAPDSTVPSYLWNPSVGRIDDACFAGVERVVHLAGENISEGRWTSSKKSRILQSRIQSTQLLCRSLAELDSPPRVLVSASAVGFYGDRGAELLSEESTAGAGFLAEVCQAWEQHTEPARQAGIRCVRLRIGVVLTPSGGALAKMLPAFRLGLGGRIGSGNQFMSWIALPDLLAVIDHVLESPTIEGPVNAVAPGAVTNRQFTGALSQALGRPALLPLPAVCAKWIFGEMAEATILASTRATPAKLLASGFRFSAPEIADALQGLR